MAAAPPKRQKKPVFRTESPFVTDCPELSQQDQLTALDLLCALLSPIGDHRRSITPSKGRRARKRKVDEVISRADETPPNAPHSNITTSRAIVGLNHITRHLENVSAAKQTEDSRLDRVAAIFIASSQDSVVYSHLPALCVLASKITPSQPAIRLVFLGASTGDRLTQALGLSRVGVIGVLEGQASVSLIEYLRERLPAIRSPLLDDAAGRQYLAVKIGSSD